MDKRIIFFDGDGTIWYPKSTKRNKPPHWIYNDKSIGKRYLHHLTLTPSVVFVLNRLRKAGITLILLSTHPHLPKKANLILKSKIRNLKLENVFDGFYATRDFPNAKGEMILRVLKKRHLYKSQALMIGDSYRYDYLSAKAVGVDALLIKSKYMKHPTRGRRVQKVINGVQDILNLVELNPSTRNSS